MSDTDSNSHAFAGTGYGPGSPLQALLGDVVSCAHDRSLRLLLAALEHLLEQQTWARQRLRAHVGRTILIALDGAVVPGLPAPEVRATINELGLLRLADSSVEPHATLRFKPSADALFDLFKDGAQGAQRHLRIDGEVGLAATLGELAQHLRWDAEEDLSRMVGDVAAHRIARLAGQAAARLRDLGLRAGASAGQFATAGRHIVIRPQLQQLTEAAAMLDRRLKSLESRVDKLTASPG